ncbi:hypothetical protein BDN72DRAFT_888220 [Pluteus cervinus]|uniref:Uncharacterized protein n=1 Tax=Pluteus cervinus TaxID=181527 RepID=A0ACD3AVE7_9AGAR|nr:hypothetical protein BDN72DRAFT_888220 [Pluteus cervinus]
MTTSSSSSIPPLPIPNTLVFAYYCSGHGYGHATRVSAFAAHLLSLNLQPNPSSLSSHRPCTLPKIEIHIASSAPPHVFSTSLALGAQYRHAFIDPVIVQPLAYSVDRDQSVAGLMEFLEENRAKEILDGEIRWLKDEIKADCVLSDAAFLGCLAAKLAGIPSILVTNFTFDSVYSYLSTSLLQDTPSIPRTTTTDSRDTPIPPPILSPLTSQLHTGYRHADLLILLPGAIPIPSFTTHPGLPSTTWVDTDSVRSSHYGELNDNVRNFLTNVHEKATAAWEGEQEIRIDTEGVWPRLPYPSSSCSDLRPLEEWCENVRGGRTRGVVYAPLIVRPPSKHIPTQTANQDAGDGDSDLDVYSAEGRSRFLASIGIPERFHDQKKTKVLVVSFGGQVVKSPRRYRRPVSASRYDGEDTCSDSSRSRSPTPTPLMTPVDENGKAPSSPVIVPQDGGEADEGIGGGSLDWQEHGELDGRGLGSPRKLEPQLLPASISSRDVQQLGDNFRSETKNRKAYVSKGLEGIQEYKKVVDDGGVDDVRLLPDETWIAVVCGVPKEQWDASRNDNGDDGGEDGGEGEDEMNRFFVAPKDVYMPDLTAVADVLLGKLGYGTTSECVDACTPFVYVSRPLFVEEHGLKLLLQREGAGVEMPREAYEAGNWAKWVAEAWELGRSRKEKKRREEVGASGEDGVDLARGVTRKGRVKRAEEGRKLVEFVVRWLSGSDERAPIISG